MACEHKRLKSVNCVIMCADCGAVMTQRCSRTGRVKETTEEETTSFVTPQSGATPSPEGEGKGKAAEAAGAKKRGRKKKEA